VEIAHILRMGVEGREMALGGGQGAAAAQHAEPGFGHIQLHRLLTAPALEGAGLHPDVGRLDGGCDATARVNG